MELVKPSTRRDIVALLIGRLPAASGLKEGDSLDMILDECLEGYDFPVATGLNFAYKNPITMIPIGTKVVVDVDDFNFVYLEACVKK